MNQSAVLQDLEALPPEAQKQVVDFIAFLQTRYRAATTKRKPKPSLKLRDESFVGIWCHRDDMQDSTEWVRGIRSREWGQNG